VNKLTILSIMNQKINRIRQILIVVVLVAMAGMFSSCEKYTFSPPEVDPDTPWSFRNDIQPMFNSSCTSCHGGAVAPDLREGRSYQALTRGGYLETPAASSRLYMIMIAPSHAARSTEADKLRVLYWITQGAEDN
jgi:hypothetical protein